MARHPMRFGLDLSSRSYLLISASVSLDQSESQESETSSSLSLDMYMTESVEWSESFSLKSISFLDKLNFCIITFLAILEFQDATELGKGFNQNETDKFLGVK